MFDTVRSGRASFWGDAYTIRKWTRNLRKKFQICIPTERNRETNAAFWKHFSDLAKYKCSSQTMCTYSSMFHDHCVMFCLGTCWDRVRLFAAAHITSMILHTARFLCILLYTQKFVLMRLLCAHYCLINARYDTAATNMYALYGRYDTSFLLF